MKTLKTTNGMFGRFNNYNKQNDGYLCDGVFYPFTVIGTVLDIVDASIQDVYIEVPQTLTPRQLRLQLLSVGLLDDVEALCATDRAMSIWFEYSLDFQRSHEMIEAMAVQLGLTQDNMDNFFIEANKL